MNIVDIGSITRASKVLHVAQSALSQQVAALEGEFELALLVRDSRGVRPTEAGARLYRQARIVLQRIEDTKAAVTATSDSPRGTVTFGMPLSHVAPLALPLFEAVRRRFPSVALKIYEERSALIANRIRSGQFELGLVFAGGDEFEGLTLTPLLEERLFVLVSPKSPLAKRKSVRLRELQDMELILPSNDHGVRNSLERAMARAGGTIDRVQEENSFSLMRLATAAGMGATVSSWASVRTEIEGGLLTPVEIIGPHVMLTSVLCHLPQAARSEACECVKKIVQEVILAGASGGPWRGARLLNAGTNANHPDMRISPDEHIAFADAPFSISYDEARVNP